MKTTSLIRSLACAVGISAVASSGLMAQAPTATTKPLGYYTHDFVSGDSLVVIGLVSKNDFAGESTALANTAASSTITQAGATWTPGDFATGGGTPSHYVQISEPGHTWDGLVLDIISNGADSVVVSGDLGDFLSAAEITAGTIKYTIRAHVTLDTLFPNGGGFADFSDGITLYNENSVDSLILVFGAWTGDGIGGETIIRPGQGFVVTSTNGASIVIGGNNISAVHDGPTITPIYAGNTNIVGLVNPLVSNDGDAFPPSERILGDMNFTSFMNDFQDGITVYSRDGTLSNPQSVIQIGGNLSDPNVPVPVGTAVVVNRPLAGGDAFWQTLPLLP